jgi:hypothetical protein
MVVLIESNWTSLFFVVCFCIIFVFVEVGYFERMKPERKKIEVVIDD